MEAKLLYEHEGKKTIALTFDQGSDFISTFADFAKKDNLGTSHFTGTGAFSDAVLGYFDRDRMDYKEIPVKEQVEVLSLIGSLVIDADTDEPMIRARVVLGRSDGTTRGGHVLEAHVWPTLEVIVVEEPEYVEPVTGEEEAAAPPTAIGGAAA
jgi:uncharacterized protein